MQGQDTSSGLRAWLDRNVMDLGRQMRWSYLPPLMVYVAAGVSGLTGIVGTFFVKEYLGLSAAFLAALGFWAGIPWALKMPLGHLVDLLWRFKGVLVFVGAGLITASLSIMLGLLTERAALEAFMPVDAWYVASVLLAPIGYVLQDVVAALTVAYDILVGGLLVPILGGLVWRRGTNVGAIAAMAVGTVATLATMTILGDIYANEPIYAGLGLDTAKDFPTVEFMGNCGSASLPATAALAVQAGRLKPGQRLAMLGIGSGINCTMLGVEW